MGGEADHMIALTGQNCLASRRSAASDVLAVLAVPRLAKPRPLKIEHHSDWD